MFYYYIKRKQGVGENVLSLKKKPIDLNNFYIKVTVNLNLIS
jgi:hypothetical protein